MVFLSPDSNLADQVRKEIDAAIAASHLEVAGWRVVPINTDVCGEIALRTLPRIEQVFVNAPADMPRGTFNRQLFFARRRAEKKFALLDPNAYVASLSSVTISYKGMVLPEFLQEFYPDLKDARLESSVCLFHQRFSTNTMPEWKLAQPFRFLAHNGEINTIQGNRNWALARANNFRSDKMPDISDLDPIVSLTGSDSCSLDNMLEVMRAAGMDVLQSMRILIPPAWQAMDTLDPDVRAFYEFFDCQTEPWDGPAGIVLTDGRYAACCLDRNGLRPARYVITKDRHITIASEIGVYDYPAGSVVSKGRLGPGEMLAVDLRNGRLLNNEQIHDELKSRFPYKKWLKQGVRYLDSELIDTHTTAEPMDPGTLLSYQKMFNLSAEERNEVVRVLADAEHEAVGSMGDDTPMPVLSTQVRSLFDSFRQQFAQVTNPPIDSLREMSADSHAFIDLNYAEDVSLKDALTAVCDAAEQAVKDGKLLLLLSDRYLKPGLIPMHALLATGAVHQRLVRTGLRCAANILVETGVARDPHHFAVLIGFGATAVYPYLAYQTLYDLGREGAVDKGRQLGRSYRRGIRKGLFKIMSKMGISSISSYRGAQLFEIIGLHHEVVEQCFSGTVSRIEGAKLEDLHDDQISLANEAWDPRKPVRRGGLIRYAHNGEYHCYNPDVISALQAAVRSGDYEQYRKFATLVNERPVATLRDLLQVNPVGPSTPLAEVEPIEDILPRFDSAGMSLGALSPEAHEALAIAMNRLGARSNSGEGGEDPARYNNERVSKIKQVASGRFGVTAEYLANAEVIQIKIAQGAKPGEGGQLPGHKVTEMIARLRYAKLGVGLISPPPHHDIYSIEDLAQLIFDLKQVNPEALISVKLVSEPGVGTIAAGVVKAYADMITISGYDGGTGASPLTSVKYAGSPWELGLAEAHQVLRANDLRHRVRLQTDGGLKTGLDVIKAAILGAESFAFGTGPMVALGCKYLRICHLNNCATGVATQNNILRSEYFTGLPEMVMNYFRFVAEEVREHLSALGVRRLTDIIGRVDMMEQLPGDTRRHGRLNLQALISDQGLGDTKAQFCSEPHNVPFDKGELTEAILKQVLPAIEAKSGGEFEYEIRNNNRSIGARLSGEIARRYGNEGMADAPVTIRLRGTAGQSFGAWNVAGVHLELEGDANDYVGKGMAAGRIVIRPPAGSLFASQDAVIIGNTCLYGATGGELFAAGQAGERFAVRNSGATAVVESAGDHCCEYMTDGCVVILGRNGINFGAGITGGFAYVLDLDREFVDFYHHGLIDIHRITPESMEAHLHHLRSLIEAHVHHTGSAWGSELLEEFRTYLPKFWVVKPKAAELDSLIDSLREAA